MEKHLNEQRRLRGRKHAPDARSGGRIARWTANWAKSWAKSWARRRQGLDPNPVVLRRRRIYILPTRQGAVFGALLFAMLLGSMNYSSSVGFLITFMLTSLAFVAMHHTHRNLEQLEVHVGHADPVFAGNHARFPFHLRNNAAVERRGIALDDDERTHDIADLAPGASVTLFLRVPAARRGWLRLARVGLHTTYPFGLFRAWVWLHFDAAALVYPAPAATAPLPPPVGVESGNSRTEGSGQEDFTGLRVYRPGDAPRHVAWRASARTGRDLLVKEFKGGGAATRWFRWEDAAGDTETRLALLTRWVVDAHVRDERWGLVLPDATLGVADEEKHYQRCLRALALYGLERA